MELAEVDVSFLNSQGFEAEDPAKSGEDDQGWVFYALESIKHELLGELFVTVGLVEGKILVENAIGNTIIEKDFTHANLLTILNFLQVEL